MDDAELLTHAYLEAHPADAARVLEQLPSDQCAALFERVPARFGAPVLAAMLPIAAGQCLQRLEETRAAMLLAATSVPAAAAMLRYVPEPQRGALLDALPTGQALACRALLGFPEDTVGACVDPQIVTLAPDSRVGDALEALRVRRFASAGPVYVVDASRRALGQIELPALLRAGAHERVDGLCDEVPEPLSAMTSIAGALRHRTWLEADFVPVVDRGGGLVGVVQRRALQRALRQRVADDANDAQSVVALLAGAYWQSVSGLVEASVTLLAAPRTRP